MANKYDNHEWLSLIDVSGPFLAVPVLERAFSTGLDQLDSHKKKILRQAYDEWREALDLEDAQLPEIHRAWVELVLKQGLELDEDGDEETLKPRNHLPESLSYRQLEYGVTLRPDYAVVDDQKDDAPLMLVSIYAPDVDLDATMEGDGWASTPAERMVQLCRATETRLGLVTNGERWMLIDAPVGAVTTFASWYARLWAQEPITLQAFVTLLGIRRFFTGKDEQLPALFDDSLQHQDEVTDALGKQVQRAVEVLIQALDRADLDRNRELLIGVKPTEFYEAALTLMMRLVFLLSAEERELMDVVKDERFQTNYAVSSLRMQLREQAGLHSEEILSHRRDAWSRLLAIFRAVYGGIEHEALRMPALGGSLFDPDRFPFLEGRAKGTSWKIDEAKPLPIDNRTVLLLLDAIQLFQGRTLSYRALDVENIGYVYEGLLERTVERAKKVTLDLDATKSAKTPWVSLDELEAAQVDGKAAVEKLLRERTGSSISRVRKDLKKVVDSEETGKLFTACHADQDLCNRIEPYFHLLRTDSWGYPLVYPKGTFMVTTGTGRRETGTHYTPKPLTEAIVKETLEPVVYIGPAEGTPREEWQLKSPTELLDLKICDPAMGSGAFLVQVCRWLSERLVEAWGIEERNGKFIDAEGKVYESSDDLEPLSTDTEERLVTAKRLIAERCIYGVDINPLAVELAKLSIWLVTLAKGRPFGFLDHNLRCGDSMLGIYRVDQLTELSMTPGGKGQQRLFGKNIEQAFHEAIELRHQLRQMPIRDIHDVKIMERLNAEAHRSLDVLEYIADAFIAAVFSAGANRSVTESAIATLAIQATQAVDGNVDSLEEIIVQAKYALTDDLPAGKIKRKTFHWPLEFPEVFGGSGSAGFDSIIGNPPFLGGRKIRGILGENYLTYLTKSLFAKSSANADLCSFFFRRSSVLLKCNATMGLMATNSIAQGDTREVGLAQLLRENYFIYEAIPTFEWPGQAGVSVAVCWLYHGEWKGNFILDNTVVHFISSFLTDEDELEEDLHQLKENKGLVFQGSNILGPGFVLSLEEAKKLIVDNPKNSDVIFPFLRGQDFNSRVDQSPAYFIINFFDWPLNREQAGLDYEGPVATDYPEILGIVENKVKPTRQKAKRDAYRDRWWQYAERCISLYKSIGNKTRVIFHAYTSKHICFAFAPTGIVYAGPHTVVSSEFMEQWAILQSTIFTEWVWRFSSTMRNAGIRLTPSDIRTFPFPRRFDDELSTLANMYYSERKDFMCERQIGLTKTYNLFHDENAQDMDVCSLRNLHQEMDQSVLHSFEWDIDCQEYGFYITKQGVRFTMSGQARNEVLHRLVLLNKERHEQEQQSNQPKTKVRKKTAGKTAKAKVYKLPTFDERELPKVADESNVQMDLLDFPEAESQSKPSKGNQWGNEPIDQILAWIEENTGWHGKQAILNGCQAESSGWENAIAELIQDGFIEMQNKNGLAEYREAPLLEN